MPRQPINDSNLIFIISQPRSGSTMLQALISNNEDVSTASEPWLLLPFLSYNQPLISKAIYNAETANIAISDFQKKVGKKEFDKDLSNFILKQYDKIRKTDETYVLDKTPRYYEILESILVFFPGAKIIILKRNPFAVLHSIIKTFGAVDIQRLVEYHRDLLLCPRYLHEFSMSHSNNKNIYTIKYEDIIKNAEQEMKAIYKWLDIDFKSSSLNYKSNQKFRGLLGDPTGVKTKSAPDSTLQNKWKEYESSRYWKSFYQGYSNYLGAEFLKDYGYDSLPFSKSTKIFNRFILLTKIGLPYHKIDKWGLMKYMLYSKVSRLMSKKI